jgi:hypothetical protein
MDLIKQVGPLMLDPLGHDISVYVAWANSR